MEPLTKKSISLDDFEIIKLLGKGEYGKVLLVQKRNTTQLFALKILKKNIIKQKHQVQHTLSERSVLQKAKHPNIVTFHYAFQTKEKLYLVLEYCSGGELYFHLSAYKRFSENRAKFYAACITLALNHLHCLNIIYRDLKPENIVIDAQGYPKITDFGLSKEGISKTDITRTVCGTPEYIAPEIVLRQGHGHSVDWWSLGCIIFEMLVGLPPFYVEERREVYKRIVQQQVRFPAGMNETAVDIIKKLLVKDPRVRLGSDGADEVMAHPWFNGVDWNLILERKAVPPFIPKINDPLDTVYFSEDFTKMPISESPVIPSSPVVGTFKGFSYNGSSDSGLMDIDI